MIREEIEMRRGWHCILTKREQKDDSSSFIGGKPCIPMDIPLPICKICGEPLTFFFQIAFPKEHMWAGKSLAFFYCIRAYDKHNSKEKFPPMLIGGDPIVADGVLEPDSYQTLFRAVYFDTEKGVVREDYEERVAYQRIDWIKIKKKDPSVPLALAGEPVWMGYGNERPKIYEEKKLQLVLQVAERFRFDKNPDAPSQMDEFSCLGQENCYPRKENNYTFFFDHNRVYLWATEDRENPVFGLNVQPD